MKHSCSYKYLKLNVCFWLFLFGSYNLVFCQQSTLKTVKVNTQQKLVKLPDNFILPKSVICFDKSIDSNFFSVDYNLGLLTWKKTILIDSVTFQYRIIPFSIASTTNKYKYDSIINNIYKPYTNELEANNDISLDELLNRKRLKYTGTFGRNVSFGNAQDAIFNSQFNVQISGTLADSAEIEAAITDNNIPIQPDGNTKQINELDRILIQYRKKNLTIKLGDIDSRQNEYYYANFYKRLQGVHAQQSKLSLFGQNAQVQALAGIAKGKFYRNIFQGIEGNQGPYRLQSANNDLFFIVLANSERVFIDGELMQRGLDQDYTINYNTAEITFTAKRMINRDKRIQVEFEYADRNFLNYTIFTDAKFKLSKNTSLNIAFFNMSDAKNSPINQTLNADQKKFLANLGDKYQQAYYPVFTTDTFSTDKIMYAQKDTAVNGIPTTIFVYSTNADSAKYVLNFSYVGNNNGNYMALYNGLNGKVYTWIAPVNGVKQGSYEPAQFLVTPKQNQILTYHIKHNINKYWQVYSQGAFSQSSNNLFATNPSATQQGFAFLHGWQFEKKITLQSKVYQLTHQASFETNQQDYKPIERLREVEFYRNWGLNILPEITNEQLAQVDINLVDEKQNRLGYKSKYLDRSADFKGFMHELNFQKKYGETLFVQAKLAYNNNQSKTEKGYFFKPNIELQYLPNNKLISVIYASYSLEDNQQKNKLTDSLLSNSFKFYTTSFGLKKTSASGTTWAISYSKRSNYIPNNTSMKNIDENDNYTLSWERTKQKNHQIKIQGTLRKLFTPLNNTETSILSRLEYTFNVLNGGLTGNSIYEVGNGQEQKRDVSYVEVPSGRGQYVWIDYNKDGLQQLNEFEIAQFIDQAKYIKIFTPTNQFVKTSYQVIGMQCNLAPSQIFKLVNKKATLNKVLSLINFQTSLQAQNKSLFNNSLLVNPFSKSLADTQLIQHSLLWSYAINFNRNGRWGIDFSTINNQAKNLLTYGFEENKNANTVLKFRYTWRQRFLIELFQKWQSKQLNTISFANRNYAINSWQLEPKLTISPNFNTRFSTSAGWAYGNNSATSQNENFSKFSFQLEGKINIFQKTSIQVKYNFNDISFGGAVNTTASYVLLEGLLPGKNHLWGVDFTQRLNSNLEINFSYEGRKIGENQTINVGRASVRAIL